MSLEGRTYTHARRHASVGGKIGGATWPIALLTWGESTISGAQLATIVVAFLVELYTQGIWAHFGTFDLILGYGIPTGLGRLVRAVKIEGRSPFATAAGFLGLVFSGARFHGKPWKSSQSGTIRRTRVWTAA
jgi:hypothetical protein